MPKALNLEKMTKDERIKLLQEAVMNLANDRIDKVEVREAIEAAIHGVMFEGYDENSEKALCHMQDYIYKELGLDQ